MCTVYTGMTLSYKKSSVSQYHVLTCFHSSIHCWFYKVVMMTIYMKHEPIMKPSHLVHPHNSLVCHFISILIAIYFSLSESERSRGLKYNILKYSLYQGQWQVIKVAGSRDL